MNQKDIRGDRFQVTFLLFTHENACLVRSGYLDGILGCFGALREAPGELNA